MTRKQNYGEKQKHTDKYTDSSTRVMSPAAEPFRPLLKLGLLAGSVSTTKHARFIFCLSFRVGPAVLLRFNCFMGDRMPSFTYPAGIPIIHNMQGSYVGDDITSVMGIMNGTTNFMLTKMEKEGADYAAVLKEAQDLGFAEGSLRVHKIHCKAGFEESVSVKRLSHAFAHPRDAHLELDMVKVTLP